jgi:hypothetical protein
LHHYLVSDCVKDLSITAEELNDVYRLLERWVVLPDKGQLDGAGGSNGRDVHSSEGL